MSYIAKYKIQMVNTTILRIMSDDNELLTQKRTNLPLIQGSTIAGAIRDILEKEIQTKEIKKLFGNEVQIQDVSELFGKNEQSKIYISDAIGDKLLVESRTQVKLNAKTGTNDTANKRGQLIKNEYIVPNTKFTWDAEIQADNKKQFDKYHKIFKFEIEAINNNIIMLVSKKKL